MGGSSTEAARATARAAFPRDREHVPPNPLAFPTRRGRRGDTTAIGTHRIRVVASGNDPPRPSADGERLTAAHQTR